MLPEKKELRLVTPKYCESIYQTRRRPTRTIEVRCSATGEQGCGELWGMWGVCE